MKETEKEADLIVLDKNYLTKSHVFCKLLNCNIPDILSFKGYKKDIKLSDSKGVYMLMKDNKVFYIGKTSEINRRIKQHNRKFDFDSFLFYPISDNLLLEITELVLITKYKPVHNIRYTFDLKSFKEVL